MCDTESLENHMKYNKEKANTKKYQNYATKTTMRKTAIKMAWLKPNFTYTLDTVDRTHFAYDNLFFAQFSEILRIKCTLEFSYK